MSTRPNPHRRTALLAPDGWVPELRRPFGAPAWAVWEDSRIGGMVYVEPVVHGLFYGTPDVPGVGRRVALMLAGMSGPDDPRMREVRAALAVSHGAGVEVLRELTADTRLRGEGKTSPGETVSR